MQITNFEATELQWIESWVQRNNINSVAEESLREALRTVNISFIAENITRLQSTLLCELKDSYVQQSQRYVDMKDDAYSLPELTEEDRNQGKKLIDQAFQLYNKMSEVKKSSTSGRPQVDDYKYGIPIEDARYILPLATRTNISVAMTGNKLLDLFNLLHNQRYWTAFSEFRTKLKAALPDWLVELLPTKNNNPDSELVANLYQDQFAKINSDQRMVLLTAFDNLDLKVGLGAATSTSAQPPSEKLAAWQPEAEAKARSLTNKVLGYGHGSIAEQARTTFGMMCSLVTYHQQIRHRLSENHREELTDLLTAQERPVLIPPTIQKSDFVKEFKELTEQIREFRRRLLADYAVDKVLPFLLNCEQIKLIISTNARIDNQMLAERICQNAQWEIRELSATKLRQLRELSDILYEEALPPCIYGDCTEGALSCGQQKEMRDKWRMENKK